MREVLFRGKRKYNGEWVEGFYYKDLWSDNAHYIIYDGTDYVVIPKTVGQYTGLTDKNGTKIFEDDIVNDEQSGYNYFIKWFPECACFSLANRNGHMEFGCDELEVFLNDLVVVGNIHDNPEFLKGE